MAVIPPANLPPESTPWGREMQNRVEGYEREIASLKTTILSIQKAHDALVGRVTQL